MTRALMLVLAIGALAAPTRAQVGAVWDVHDPCLVRAGDTYYLFCTGNGIPIRRSSDLYHWEAAGQVFDVYPAWCAQQVPGVGKLWAPDISEIDGVYYLYYSVSTFGSQRSRIGLATNVTLDPADPRYAWVDRGPVVGSDPGDDYNAIDPDLIEDDGGRSWLAFGSFWTGIKLAPLTPARDAVARALLPRGRLYGIAARPSTREIEAPFLVRQGGYHYLFASVDRCCMGVNSTYKVVVGRSRSLTGPYVDRRGRPMLQGGGSLVVTSSGRVRGPGHNAVLRDGPRDWFAHHYYDEAAGGRATLLVRPLLWSADGWPLAGDPIDGPVPCVGPPAPIAAALAGRWRQTIDGRDSAVVTLAVDGRASKPGSSGTWRVQGQALSLSWSDRRKRGAAQVDQCAVDPYGRWYVGRTPTDNLVHAVRLAD